MARHIGIVACSAEGAALCYRTICLEASSVMGEHNHPEITLDSIPMARHMEYIRVDEWQGVADLMLLSATRLSQIGAQFAVCPDNTVHQALDLFRDRSPIPWLHIAHVVTAEADRKSFRRVGVLGTRYLMEGPVYASALAAKGIEMAVPNEQARDAVDTIIFKELVNAVFRDEARRFLYDQIEGLKQRGCEAVILGCTELPLIVLPSEAPLPVLDSTSLLAKAAVGEALRAATAV